MKLRPGIKLDSYDITCLKREKKCGKTKKKPILVGKGTLDHHSKRNSSLDMQNLSTAFLQYVSKIMACTGKIMTIFP